MITNKVIFSSFKPSSEFDILKREANLLLFENKEFFDEIFEICIESSKLNDSKFTNKGKFKSSDMFFNIEGISFCLHEITYDIDGDLNEITRIFNFIINYEN